MKYKIDLHCIHCKAPISIEVLKNNFGDHRCLACGVIFSSETNDHTALIYVGNEEVLKLIDTARPCCCG
jgi:uncharacterized Zn finger protein